MVKIAVFVSGGGTNLQALIDYQKKSKECPYRIVLVISNNKRAFAIERAKKEGIPCIIISATSAIGEERVKQASRKEKQEAVTKECLLQCKEQKVEAIVLAGYLTILGGTIIEAYKNRIINLHPALLPLHGGEGMWGDNVHKAVLQAGERETGCTVHIVTCECDRGEILVQKRIPVLAEDSVESIKVRLSPIEHEAIVEGTCKLCERI